MRKDYTLDHSIFRTEDERTHAIKEIVLERLDEADRIIILLYADCQSYRKLGARLGMSHTLAASEIKRIKNKIIELYEHLY